MIPQTRKFFVILVHYGSPDATNLAINSLLSGTLVPRHILVVDHGDSPFSLHWNPRQVTVVRPHSNSGYAAGCNLGLGWLGQQGVSPRDIIVCANNDLIFSTSTLAVMSDWWHATSCADALASPVIIEPSGRVSQISSVNCLTGRALPYCAYSKFNFLFNFPYLHGACLSAPYSVWMSLGGWPVGFDMYWEDVFLSRFASLHNIKLSIITKTKVTHSTSPARKPSAKQSYYLVRNGAWVMSHISPWYWRRWWRLWNYSRYLWHLALRHDQIYRPLAESFSFTPYART